MINTNLSQIQFFSDYLFESSFCKLSAGKVFGLFLFFNMSTLWQNLHDFYVSKFSNLQVFTRPETQAKNVRIDQITQTWQELYSRVYGYFWKRIENLADVENLTSLVLSSFLTSVENGKVDQDNFGYLWQIARNSLFEYCRQKSKIPLSLADFNEDIVDEKLSDQNQELVQKIKNAAQKCLQESEFTMFCDYYSCDLAVVNNSNQDFQNLISKNFDVNDSLVQKYNLKPAALRQKIHRIKLKLQKELARQNNLKSKNFTQ